MIVIDREMSEKYMVINRFKEVCDSISTNKRSIYHPLGIESATFYRYYNDRTATINLKVITAFYNTYKIPPSDFYAIERVDDVK